MFTNCLFGTSIAGELPDVSSGGGNPPKCVGDVLSRLEEDPLYPKICSALNRFAEFVGKPSALEMDLDLVLQRKPGFRPYLEQRNYRDASICHYVQWVYVFLTHAEAFGWVPDGNMTPEWSAILLHPKMNCPIELVRYFACSTNSPTEVSHPTVTQWVDEHVKSGERTFEAAYKIANMFVRCLLESGYYQVDPVKAVRLDGYGVPLKEFPSPLKGEVEKLLALRQSELGIDDEFEVDDDLDDLDLEDYRDRSESDESRPPHSQIRAITAKLLLESICRLYGYLRNIRGKKDITSLQQLFNPRVLESCRRWLKKERKVSDSGLRATLVPILSAMQQSRDFDPKLLTWITTFRIKLGKKPSQDEIRFKKAQKQLEYAEVAAIPGKIYKERTRLAHKKVDSSTLRGAQIRQTTLSQLARLSMRELAIRWILVLPWRQRNLRQMRIDGPDPNLFKSHIPNGIEIDRPQWVKDEELKNPKAEFWLYRFTAEENKTGKLIFCVLPKHLVAPLEDYLLNWRPKLLEGKDTQTLFLNTDGGEMSAKTFAFMMYEISLRYGGKRMNPHIFRDVFAYAYLKSHPRDFVQLSIQLWHSSINTTMEHYAGKFNASCGTAAVEAWLDEFGVF